MWANFTIDLYWIDDRSIYIGGKIYVTVLSLVGKFAISAAWQCIIVWGNELYPTTLRCTLSSINSVVGKIGSVIAPFLIDLVSLSYHRNENHWNGQ